MPRADNSERRNLDTLQRLARRLDRYLRLLVAAGIAATSPHYRVVLGKSYPFVQAPLQEALGADSLAHETADGVPISLLFQNDGYADDHFLGGNVTVARCVVLRRSFLTYGSGAMMPA
jgi:hypothetical protein